MRLTRRGQTVVGILIGMACYVVAFTPPGWWL